MQSRIYGLLWPIKPNIDISGVKSVNSNTERSISPIFLSASSNVHCLPKTNMIVKTRNRSSIIHVMINGLLRKMYLCIWGYGMLINRLTLTKDALLLTINKTTRMEFVAKRKKNYKR